MKKYFLIFILILILLFGGCFYAYKYYSDSTDIDEISLNIADTLDLKSYAKASNKAHFKLLSISDETVLTIDDNGILTVIADGMSEVKYSVNGKKYNIIINSEISTSNAAASSIPTINNPNQTSQELRVLIIRIDPTLTAEDLSGTGLQAGKKVSEYMGQSAQTSIDELKWDLESTSHGYLKVNTYKTEYLNEFPTYKAPYTLESNKDTVTDQVSLPNGRTGYRFNAKKYVKYSYNKSEKRLDWQTLYENKVLDGGWNRLSDGTLYYDYKYIIDKFNLIERRKNDEFDQVWLVGIDPMMNYETIMVGNDPYWVNAPGYVADCPDFLIGGASMSRRDAQFHALGHGMESILRAAYSRKFSEYKDYTRTTNYKYYKISYNAYADAKEPCINKETGEQYQPEDCPANISTVEEYNKLNLFEKYSLSKFNNKGGYTGVGTTHHPFNAEKDYDYTNTNSVQTNWQDWLNYPNISGTFKQNNNKAWKENTINTTELRYTDNKSDDRLYQRLWFSLLPHNSGYDVDGRLANWWKYFVSLDFVDSITETKQNITIQNGNYVPISAVLNYNSNKTFSLTRIPKGNNVQISNKNVLTMDGYDYVYAKNPGTSEVTINYDGKAVTYNVIVTVTAPTASSVCSNPTYNNKQQQITKFNSVTGYKLSGYNQTNAGTYKVTATLDKGYTWNDGTTGAKTVNCSIKKATPTVTVTPTTLEVENGKTANLSEKSTVAGTFKNTSSSSNVSISSNATTLSASANNSNSVTVTGKAVGTATITVEFTPSNSNYAATKNTYSVNVVASTSNLKSASIPTKSLCKNTIYNAKQQQITTSTSGTGYTLSGYNQTNAGTYTITAKLKSGYKWSDGSTTTKTFKCSIDMKTPTITVTPTSLSIVSGKIGSISEKANIAGTFKNTINNTNIATVKTGSSMNVTANTANSFTFTGKATGSTTITVNFTPTNSNYKATSNSYTIKVTAAQTSKEISVPLASEVCKNPSYTGNIQQITKIKSGTGYTLSNYNQKAVGKYAVVAKLNSGYKWKDKTTTSKTIYCEIKAASYSDTINGNRCYVNGNTKLIYYITQCQSSSLSDALCKYSKIEGTAKTGTVPRSKLKMANSCPNYTDTINGNRCYVNGSTKILYYITKCESASKSDALCKYTKKNNSSSIGTVLRSKLKMASNC